MTAMHTDPLSRLKGELKDLERLARDRLQGTRVGGLLDALPNLVERELDTVLGRVGLMRKPATDSSAVEAAHAVSDVDVSAAVINEIAVENEVDAPSHRKPGRKPAKAKA